MKLNLLLFIICPLFVIAQNNNEYFYKYKLYRINVNQDQTQSNSNKDIVDYVGMNKTDTIEYELHTNKKESTFLAEQKLYNEQTGGLNFSEIIIQSNGSWYYNLADSAVYNTLDLNGRKISIKYDYNYIDWHYTQEVENIGGYKCKAAIYSRNEELMNGEKRDYNITVWYSDEINPNAMPFGFVGLPGGIVKINFNGFTEAVLAEFGHDKKKKTKSYSLRKVVSLSEYENIQLEQSNKYRELRDNGVDID